MTRWVDLRYIDALSMELVPISQPRKLLKDKFIHPLWNEGLLREMHCDLSTVRRSFLYFEQAHYSRVSVLVVGRQRAFAFDITREAINHKKSSPTVFLLEANSACQFFISAIMGRQDRFCETSRHLVTLLESNKRNLAKRYEQVPCSRLRPD